MIDIRNLFQGSVTNGIIGYDSVIQRLPCRGTGSAWYIVTMKLETIMNYEANEGFLISSYATFTYECIAIDLLRPQHILV